MSASHASDNKKGGQAHSPKKDSSKDSHHEVIITFTVPQNLPEDRRLNVQLEDGRVFAVELPVELGAHPGEVRALLCDDQTSTPTLLFLPPKHHDSDGKLSTKAVVGTVAAGTVLGVLVAGPIGGVVAFAASFYGATHYHEGDVTKAKEKFLQTSVGQKTAAIAESAMGQMHQLDEKLHVSDAVKATSQAVASTAHKIDEKTGASERISAMSASMSKQMHEFDESHHISEKLNSAGEKISQTTNDMSKKVHDIDEQYKISETVAHDAEVVSQSMSAAGAKISETAKQVDSKYHISESVSNAATAVENKAASIMPGSKAADAECADGTCDASSKECSGSADCQKSKSSSKMSSSKDMSGSSGKNKGAVHHSPEQSENTAMNKPKAAMTH